MYLWWETSYIESPEEQKKQRSKDRVDHTTDHKFAKWHTDYLIVLLPNILSTDMDDFFSTSAFL